MLRILKEAGTPAALELAASQLNSHFTHCSICELSVGTDTCELPRFSSADIGDANVLRKHGSAAIVTLPDDATAAPVLDRTAFLKNDAFGKIQVTPEDSFLF